jgi:DNA-binding NarL/FixJ family response regulator
MDLGTSPLIGRKAECAAITRALEGTGARSVVIVGPPGVGRTRLAREALRLAEGRGHRTRWAAATEASALVPLGALAHILPPVDAVSDALVLMQRTVRALAAGEAERPAILAVDDVHLLDRLSISLLYQLAASGAVSLVLTVRTGHGFTDPVAPLWKDGLATRLELQPLSRKDADLLVDQVLGGEVDTRTSERLWQLSVGNPLVLDELLADGRRAGLLQERAGLWRWRGPMRPSQRLSEIALAQLGHLNESEWRVLEVLAAEEPLSIDRLVELSSPGAVAALVRRGVIVEQSAGGSHLVHAAQPLYTAVIGQRTSAATLRAVRQRLVEGRPWPTSLEGLRSRSAVLLDGDPATQDPDVLTEAARRANALLDHPLAEKLAQAGIEAGGGAQAHLALVEAAQWKGEPARSEQAATAAAPVAASEGSLVQLTVMRAISLFFGLDRASEAFAVLQEAAASIHDEEEWAWVTAAEAYFAFFAGEPQRATDTASAVLKRARPDGVARPLAAGASAAGLAVAGRTGTALELARSGWEALDKVPTGPETALLRLALIQAEVLALRYGGDMRKLEQRAAALHEANLAAPEWAGDAVIAFYRGCAALASGRLSVAIRWLVEALAGLDERDPMGLLPLCASELATARALIGDVDGARKMIREAQGTARQMLPAFRPHLRLAEAWLAVADSRVDEGADYAVEAAALAASTGQWCIEAIMLHAAAGLGRGADVLPRLRTLANELDSPLAGVFAAHVEALVTTDGARLDDVTKRFENMGALLLAANAAADAGAAYEASGERAAAAASRAAALELVRQCELPKASGAALHPHAGLTSREREIARQAARGLSNQEIAADLVLSVRTVETHLAHVYAKLGIGSRRQLAQLLDEPTNRPSHRR